mmetsp:Transcript_6807/g.18766  ORF Transcript_6807/g.18766 Transcript_6807/m.18766 type:complete len:320 (+) Transcript_6807:963-1922(+)
MDDGSMALVLALLHGGPDFGDPRAGCVHDLDIPLLQEGHLIDGSPKGRQNDDVALADSGVILATIGHGLDELHAHLGEILVDQGIVDDFVGHPDVFVREEVPGLVSHSNCTLHTPAKPIGLRQDEGDVTNSQAEAVGAELGHQIAAADIPKLFHRRLHLRLPELEVLIGPLQLSAEILSGVTVDLRERRRFGRPHPDGPCATALATTALPSPRSCRGGGGSCGSEGTGGSGEDGGVGGRCCRRGPTGRGRGPSPQSGCLLRTKHPWCSTRCRGEGKRHLPDCLCASAETSLSAHANAAGKNQGVAKDATQIEVAPNKTA